MVFYNFKFDDLKKGLRNGGVTSQCPISKININLGRWDTWDGGTVVFYKFKLDDLKKGLRNGGVTSQCPIRIERPK